MRFSTRRRMLLVLPLLGVWACSSGESGGSGGVGAYGGAGATGGAGGSGGASADCSSIETKTISQLSPVELGVMCDCVAEKLGGYGNEITCGGTTLLTPDNQQECVDDIMPHKASCGVLVEVAYSCADDRHACVLTSTACAELDTCN